MKKLIAIALVLTMALALVACGNTDAENTTAATTTAPTETSAPETSAPETSAPETSVPETTGTEETPAPSEVMSYAEYAAAELDAAVCVETYVQATQEWWDNKITVYTQDLDGAYFIYEMACTEEDAAKLEPGTKIRVTGYKGEFNGEIEILDATFEFVEDGDTYVAEALDVTEYLGTEDLELYQNMYVAMKGLTVSEISFKNGEPGDDIYVNATINDVTVALCVERYLTDPETDVYAAVSALEVGDVFDMEGFLYWYEGANPHITSITVAE